MTTTAEISIGIPVRHISAAELPAGIAEKRRVLQEYEQRYELSSAEMVDLVDRDAIVPDIEVIKWYQTYDALQFLLAMTPTTGTHGTTTRPFTTAA